MKILITGGTGFIGLHTARAFLDAGHEVVSTQFRVRRDPSFIAKELGGRMQREVLDITSPYGVSDVLRKHKIDGIVHLAVPGVGASALSASEDYRTNMLSLLNIFDAALTFGVARVVVASSVVVYEGTGKGPHVETKALPVTSTNATTAFKKAWEILGAHFADRSKLDIVSVRIGYIYGPLYHSMYNILARMVHTAVRGGDLVKPNEAFAGDSFDYCYVKDCAAGLAALQTSTTLKERVYNIGAGPRDVGRGDRRCGQSPQAWPDVRAQRRPARRPARPGELHDDRYPRARRGLQAEVRYPVGGRRLRRVAAQQ